jgi:hypothetical protein
LLKLLLSTLFVATLSYADTKEIIQKESNIEFDTLSSMLQIQTKKCYGYLQRANGIEYGIKIYTNLPTKSKKILRIAFHYDSVGYMDINPSAYVILKKSNNTNLLYIKDKMIENFRLSKADLYLVQNINNWLKGNMECIDG